MNLSTRVAAFAAALAFGVGSAAANAGTLYSGGVVSPDGASGAYCKSTGGKVQNRVPEYGQNSSGNLILSGSHKFCDYTSGGSYPSHIYVFIDTLYTTEPTLAALAYYAQVQPGQCNGNPASCYCTLLGGSDQFGTAGDAGGSWYDPKDQFNPSLETCIFPDLSSIDSWGLTYHSFGVIRGIDLSTVLRYANPYGSLKTHGSRTQVPFRAL